MKQFYTKATDRSLFLLEGEDVTSFLQGLITQDISKLENQKSLYTCLLTPQGKIIADFFLYDLASKIILDCDTSIAETLFKKLRLYKLRAKVEIKPCDEEYEIFLHWNEEGSSLEQDNNDPRLAALGTRSVVSSDSPLTFNDNAHEASLEDYQSHCMGLGVPQFGIDFETEKVFPLDMNFDVLKGVDYKKGCFVGQEVASRMKRKGEIRKRVWIATFEGTPPQKGEAIKAGDTTLGSISSVVGKGSLANVRLDRLGKNQPPYIAENGSIITLTPPRYLEENA